ncbi:MAG: Crp/Fnr family transcriptional regulator [Deltaproteobacteria bacterium]|nr:MAG: Crp/Fnr family transcriptional regulator [Deltaproteobacteria bacterium]PIE73613.1 MAG: Crp/Fnr family transcriptional regulator [Deltaproteobacteria bacterium]
MEHDHGVFVATEDSLCPLYSVGDEFRINDVVLTPPPNRSTCLTLACDLAELLKVKVNGVKPSRTSLENSPIQCSGCRGFIRLQFKRDKEFATVQMRLLAARERRHRSIETTGFIPLLRAVPIFKSLSSEELIELSALLELKEVLPQTLIARKGDKGSRLYILLTGCAHVLDAGGAVLARLGSGEIFGEMSLLSGERVLSTIQAVEKSVIAVMSLEGFKQVFNRFPDLYVSFYRLLVSRIAKMNALRAHELSSDMTGQISDISVVELCQMINSSQKTGRLVLRDNGAKYRALFNAGELVYATGKNKTGIEAFYEILALENGRFTFTQGLNKKEMDLDVLGSFIGLIMEGVQRIDDGKGGVRPI